jgi:hypothetical protein
VYLSVIVITQLLYKKKKWGEKGKGTGKYKVNDITKKIQQITPGIEDFIFFSFFFLKQNR